MNIGARFLITRKYPDDYYPGTYTLRGYIACEFVVKQLKRRVRCQGKLQNNDTIILHPGQGWTIYENRLEGKVFERHQTDPVGTGSPNEIFSVCKYTVFEGT